MASFLSLGLIYGIIRFLEPNNQLLQTVTVLQGLAVIFQSYEVFTYYFQMQMQMKVVSLKEQSKQYIYYFGVPEHSNLGDLAQCYCIRRYFEKYFSDYAVIEVFSRNYLDNSFGLRDYLKSAIKQEDLIFFQSGYCTQDLGGREDLMHQAVIQDFPDNKLILLPQTVFFQNRNRKEQASQVYDAHRRLLFLARDQISYEYAKDMFPHLRIEAYPDIVTTLIGQYEYSFERDGILFCIRNDAEKYYSDTEINKLIEYFRETIKCDKLDTTIRVEPEVIRADLKNYIEGYFEKFAHYKVIITDRYHGTIFSLISNTPVIVIKTKDHKVKTGVDWFKGRYDDQVSFAESLEDAKTKAENILKEHEYACNPPIFEKEFYEKLRNLVEDMG